MTTMTTDSNLDSWLTVREWPGQHSQFLRCFLHKYLLLRFKVSSVPLLWRTENCGFLVVSPNLSILSFSKSRQVTQTINVLFEWDSFLEINNFHIKTPFSIFMKARKIRQPSMFYLWVISLFNNSFPLKFIQSQRDIAILLVVGNLRIVAQWWTLSESHSRRYFGILKPAVFSIA